MTALMKPRVWPVSMALTTAAIGSLVMITSRFSSLACRSVQIPAVVEGEMGERRPPLTSPVAYTPGTEVARYSSTATKPVGCGGYRRGRRERLRVGDPPDGWQQVRTLDLLFTVGSVNCQTYAAAVDFLHAVRRHRRQDRDSLVSRQSGDLGRDAVVLVPAGGADSYRGDTTSGYSVGVSLNRLK